MAGRGASREFRVQVDSLKQWLNEIDFDGLIVVEIYSSWFGACQCIGPTISNVMLQYENAADRMKWLVINVAKIEAEQKLILKEDEKKKREVVTSLHRQNVIDTTEDTKDLEKRKNELLLQIKLAEEEQTHAREAQEKVTIPKLEDYSGYEHPRPTWLFMKDGQILHEVRSANPPKLGRIVNSILENNPVTEKELEELDFHENADDGQEDGEDDDHEDEGPYKGQVMLYVSVENMSKKSAGGAPCSMAALYYRNPGTGEFSYLSQTEKVWNECNPKYLKTFVLPKPREFTTYKLVFYDMVSENIADAKGDDVVGSHTFDLCEIYETPDHVKETNILADEDSPDSDKGNLTLVCKKPKHVGHPTRYAMGITCTYLPLHEDSQTSNPIVCLTVNDENMPKPGILSCTETLRDTTEPDFHQRIVCDNFSLIDRELTFQVIDGDVYARPGREPTQGVVAACTLMYSQLVKMASDSEDSIVVLNMRDQNGVQLESQMFVAPEEIEIINEDDSVEDLTPKVAINFSIAGIEYDVEADDGNDITCAVYSKSLDTGEYEYVGQTERIPGERNPEYNSLFLVDAPGSTLTLEEKKRIEDGEALEKEYLYKIVLHSVPSDDKRDLLPANKVASLTFNLGELERAGALQIKAEDKDGDECKETTAHIRLQTIGVVARSTFMPQLTNVTDNQQWYGVSVSAKSKFSNRWTVVAETARYQLGADSKTSQLDFLGGIELPWYSEADRRLRIAVHTTTGEEGVLDEENKVGDCLMSLNAFELGEYDLYEWDLRNAGAVVEGATLQINRQVTAIPEKKVEPVIEHIRCAVNAEIVGLEPNQTGYTLRISHKDTVLEAADAVPAKGDGVFKPEPAWELEGESDEAVVVTVVDNDSSLAIAIHSYTLGEFVKSRGKDVSNMRDGLSVPVHFQLAEMADAKEGYSVVLGDNAADTVVADDNGAFQTSWRVQTDDSTSTELVLRDGDTELARIETSGRSLGELQATTWTLASQQGHLPYAGCAVTVAGLPEREEGYYCTVSVTSTPAEEGDSAETQQFQWTGVASGSGAFEQFSLPNKADAVVAVAVWTEKPAEAAEGQDDAEGDAEGDAAADEAKETAAAPLVAYSLTVGELQLSSEAGVQKPVGDTEATVTIVCASGPRDMGQATISTVPVVQTGRVTFHTSKVSEEAPVEAGAEEKDLGGEDSAETLEFVINAVSFADTAGASRRVAFATDAQEFTDSELLDAENPRFAVEWAVRGAAADKGTLTVSDESGAGLLRVTNTLAWWAEQQTVSTSASGPFEREFTVSYAANATEGEEEPQEVTVSGTVAGEAVEAGASVSSRWVGADADVALSATVGDAVADELAANTADLFSGEGSQAGTAGVWTLTFGQAFAAAGSSFTTDVTVAEYAEQQEEAAPVAEEEAAPVAEEEAAAEPEAAVEPEAAAEPEPEAEAVAEEGDAPAPAEEEEGEEKAPEKKKKHFSEWAEALPVQAGAEWTAKRKELFASLDANSEGRLTLAELTAGLENIIHCGEELDLAALVQKAYDNACNADGQSQHAGTVEFREFWILLVYLQKYFGYMDVFDAIDENDSGKMTYDEWVAGVPIFTEKMGLVVDDLEATFNQLDQGGDKTVTFDEFFAFAVAPSIAAAKSAEEE